LNWGTAGVARLRVAVLYMAMLHVAMLHMAMLHFAWLAAIVSSFSGVGQHHCSQREQDPKISHHSFPS